MNKSSYVKTQCKPYGGTCSLCGGVNQPYMLNTLLWKSAFPEAKGRETTYIKVNDELVSSGGFFVCLRCVEDRLGRPLAEADFHEKNPPINNGIFGFDYREFCKLEGW